MVRVCGQGPGDHAAGRIALAATRGGRGITSETFYTTLRCYLENAGLPSGGVHIFRAFSRKARARRGRDGRRRVAVPRPLQPGAVTTTYLRAARGAEGPELGEDAEGDRGLVCDAPSVQFHQLQAGRETTATADAPSARQPRSAS